jgi:hypothetical protein
MTKAEWQARRAEAALLIGLLEQGYAPNVTVWTRSDVLYMLHALFSITVRWGIEMLDADGFAAWLRKNLGVAMTAEEVEELARSLPPPSPALFH